MDQVRWSGAKFHDVGGVDQKRLKMVTQKLNRIIIHIIIRAFLK